MFVMRALVKVLQPFPLIWLAMLILAVLWHRRGQRSAARAMAGLWLFTSLWSCTPLADRLLAGLEAPWRVPATQLASLAPADAIICLGGGHGVSVSELTGIDMQENSDRIITAVALLRAGKASVLYTSGGKAREEEPATEAEAAQRWATQWMPDLHAKIIALPPSVDTRDEALKMAALAKQHGWKRVILVTSASHMTRSHAVFAKACAGIEVVPAPCAFATTERMREWIPFPSETAFRHANAWWHECIGWWGYKLRGWV